MKSLQAGLSILALGGLVLSGPALRGPALAAEDFYKDKTVNIIVGFTPGGGYDAYGRQLARFMGEHIPGKPTLIVQNMPGAGSLQAVRGLDATQPKDGTVMVIFNPGLIVQSVVQPDKVPVDFRKYVFVGVVTPDFRVCYGYGPQGVKSWEDMMSRKEFILGATGKGSGNYVNGATMREVFNAPVKQILGFPGSNELRLAVERGELDGDCGSFNSIPPNWLTERKVHPFVRFTRDKEGDMPDSARFIDDFTTSPEQREILAAVNAEDEVGRPFIVSRDIPAERLAILRKAFDSLMKDPAFKADMAKQNLPVHPINGPDSDQILARMLKTPRDVADKARKIFE
jgi:tripartite-type tricarboxylate transporter receptor subunit TctC